MRCLSQQEILSCANGYNQARQTPVGVLLLRFCDEALSYFEMNAELGDGLRTRAVCTAGIVLDFETNSDWVQVDAWLGEGTRFYFAFDLFENGVLVSADGSEATTEELTARLDGSARGEKRRYQLYLPHVSWA